MYREAELTIDCRREQSRDRIKPTPGAEAIRNDQVVRSEESEDAGGIGSRGGLEYHPRGLIARQLP